MRYNILFISLLLGGFILKAQDSEVSNLEVPGPDYDYSLSCSEQPNPLYHYPIDSITTPLYINIQLVLVELDNRSNSHMVELYPVADYLDSAFMPFDVRFMMRPIMPLVNSSEKQFWEHYNNDYLPHFNDQLTIYVLPKKNLGNHRSFVPMLSDDCVIYYEDIRQFRDELAVNLAYMSGILERRFIQGIYEVVVNGLLQPQSLEATLYPSASGGLQNTAIGMSKRDADYSDLEEYAQNAWSGMASTIDSAVANRIKYNFQNIDHLKEKIFHIDIPESYLPSKTSPVAGNYIVEE